MIKELILYFAIGKLVIFLFQKARPSYIKSKFLKELFECDLCLGVWVYFFFALLFKVDFFMCYWSNPFLRLTTAMLTGMSASTIMHLISLGWKEKFSTIVIN